MFPALSIIVASYVILRCIEIITKPTTSFSSDSARTVVTVLAVIVIGLSAIELYDIVSVAHSSSLQDLQRSVQP